MAALENALSAADEDFERHLASLRDLVKIPSVSFEGWDAAALERSAAFTKNLLLNAGLARSEILRFQDAPPYVFAESDGPPDAPTVLFYCHHDVQPPMREALWRTPAFAPDERDGRMYGRGAADDKAGVILAAAAADAWRRAGGLPVQLKVLVDGEEEVGSPHFSAFLKANAERLRADVIVIADMIHWDVGVPSLTTALRGLAVVEVACRALTKPLHSGLWGGPLPDCVTGLARVLAGLVDEEGRPAIPGLLDGLVPPRDDENARYEGLGIDDRVFAEQAGLAPGVPLRASGADIARRLWREPSLTVNAFEAGTKQTAGNVLLDQAWARVGLRTAAGMDARRAQRLLADQMRALTPWGLELTVTEGTASDAWMCDSGAPAFDLMRAAMKAAYGVEPVDMGSGGSIPFVKEICDALGQPPALLVPVEDPHTNAHGENESLHLGDFRKAVLSMVRFFDLLGRGGKG